MTIGKRTKCENCASTLRWFDAIEEAHQGWWDLIAERQGHETYMPHTPERCRSIKAGADQLIVGQLVITETEHFGHVALASLPGNAFENYVMRQEPR